MKLLARDHLLSMAAAPIIWSGHFLVCYIAVALACALGWPDTPASATMLAATALALLLLGISAGRNLEKLRRLRSATMNEADAADDARMSGFIARAAMLLCLLSAVAVIWVASPALLLPACTA